MKLFKKCLKCYGANLLHIYKNIGIQIHAIYIYIKNNINSLIWQNKGLLMYEQNEYSIFNWIKHYLVLKDNLFISLWFNFHFPWGKIIVVIKRKQNYEKSLCLYGFFIQKALHKNFLSYKFFKIPTTLLYQETGQKK